ncbi:hypothetical protein PsYK624_118390 [Phanerochaete sordida]|uniref:Uncharacterized protein n=1 Tax=Phanerochaete sordida TaxID=48140 RepID=A0A9P3LI23_9APHY|nr:hypothetical protein PsYK624_118390 [Phanerochaete sordida]
MTRLPVEVSHLVISSYVAGYFEDTFGPCSSRVGSEHDGEVQEQSHVQSVLSLLLTSYQFREITLAILSRYLGVSLDMSGERLETRPWSRAFDVRAFVFSQPTPQNIVAELVSFTAATPIVALCIFAKAALREIRCRRRMCNVSAFTIADGGEWTDHQRTAWMQALTDASNACDTEPLVLPAAQTLLRECAHGTLKDALRAVRYTALIARVMHSVQMIQNVRIMVNIAPHMGYIPVSVLQLLPILRRAGEEIREEQKGDLRAEATLPAIEDIKDACSLMQRVMDVQCTESSDMLTECKTLACTLKGEWEQRLLRMR